MAQRNRVAAASRVTRARTPQAIAGSDELQRLLLSSQRPFVLMNEREISVLRRGLTKQGWKRSLYLEPAGGSAGIYSGHGVLSRANMSLGRTPTIPKRGSGPEEFYCDCGAPLLVPQDLAEAPSYKCSVCGGSCTGSAYDRALRFFQHQDLAGATLALALVYAIERDRVYAEKAAEILANYARVYPRSGSSARGIIDRAEHEAACMIALAQAYDLIYYCRSLSDEQRDEIENQLLRTAAARLAKKGRSAAHGPWSAAAVGVIGLTLRDQGMVERATADVEKLLTSELDEDGLWRGPLWRGHFHALAGLVHFAEACARTGIDIYDWEVAPGKSLKRMFSAPVQCAYPSLRLPAIDEDPFDAYLPIGLYEIACRRWDDVTFAWVLKHAYKLAEERSAEGDTEGAEHFRRRSFYAFLFGRDLPGRIGAPALKGRSWAGLGVSVLRSSDETTATLRWKPASVESHSDALSFTLFTCGQLIIPDFGPPKRTSTHSAVPGHSRIRWPSHSTRVPFTRPTATTSAPTVFTAANSPSVSSRCEGVSAESDLK